MKIVTLAVLLALAAAGLAAKSSSAETAPHLEKVLVGGYIPHDHARLGPARRVVCLANPTSTSAPGRRFVCVIRAANADRLFAIRIILAKRVLYQWLGWVP